VRSRSGVAGCRLNVAGLLATNVGVAGSGPASV
jgi:hypothetical protein